MILNTFRGFKRSTMVKKKKLLKSRLLSIPGFFSVSCLLTKEINPRVLVYHRFGNALSTDNPIIDSPTFEKQLIEIKKNFKVVSLKDYIKWRTMGKPVPKNTAVLTVDDGYFDFYEIAYPLLKKHNIEATLFPVVNFVDKKIWLWPDRIFYALENTKLKRGAIEFMQWRFEIDTRGPQGRKQAFERLVNVAIAIENKLKWEFIQAIEHQLEVEIPKLPTEKCAPVSWAQLREMTANGIEVGSHTMNHPILSRINKAEMHHEIVMSKKILEAKLDHEVVSFCYPNSYPGDINEEVVEAVKLAGYKGAVFYQPPGSGDLFKIPRIPADNDMVNFLWHLSGMEYFFKPGVLKSSAKSLSIINNFKKANGDD